MLGMLEACRSRFLGEKVHQDVFAAVVYRIKKVAQVKICAVGAVFSCLAGFLYQFVFRARFWPFWEGCFLTSLNMRHTGRMHVA